MSALPLRSDGTAPPRGPAAAARAHAAAARRAPAEALALRRRLRAAGDALRGERADRRRSPRRSGRCSTARPAAWPTARRSRRARRDRRRAPVASAGRGVEIDLALQPAGEPMEVTSPHGGSFIWTRKDPIRAVGRVTAMGRTHEIDHAGLIDASAGYHARETAWRWSAGVGTATDGRALAWNLVTGVHDARRAERADRLGRRRRARGRAGDVPRRPRRRGLRRRRRRRAALHAPRPSARGATT